MKARYRASSGFTMIELMIVLSIIVLIIPTMYRFYHESFQQHRLGLEESVARLDKTRLLMLSLEKDLKDGRVVFPHAGPRAEGPVLKVGEKVVYNVSTSGTITRVEGRTVISLADGVRDIEFERTRAADALPGLLRMRVRFRSSERFNDPLESVTRVFLLGQRGV